MNRNATGPTPSGSLGEDRALAIVLAAAAALTALRIAALFSSSLELYPDEAQYWLWSRSLAWGYASKPPLIAWLIRLTTLVGGDGEAWVRLSAPLVHAGAMLAIYPAGRRLYSPAAGMLGALLYGLMPAVQISALFVATDAPLMLFLALSLWAYAALVQARTAAECRWTAAALGLAMGLAFLAKYAAIFLVIGAVLHALTDREARRTWANGAWAIALIALLVVLGPNLAWLAQHHFATVAHTAEVNAHWSPAELFHPGKLIEFELDQFGVVGPIPLGVLLVGIIMLGRRRALQPADRLLLWLMAPALVLVSIQALLSRAHAHWAAVSYLPGVILAAAWLVRWRAKGWAIAALAIQGAVAALLLAVLAWPGIVDASGNGRRLARVRGWQATADIVAAAARSAQAHGGLTAVAVEDRYLFNELAYYGRGYFAGPHAAPLRMRPAAQALNEAQLSAPLRSDEAKRVLIAETAGQPPVPALPGDFTKLRPLGRWVMPLGGKKTREIELQIGEGYRPEVNGSRRP
jgi:4-amino-4-deoxy-L-arabinose transferase-like glycosyltransferase